MHLENSVSVSKQSGHGSIETRSLIEKHQVGTEWLTSRGYIDGKSKLESYKKEKERKRIFYCRVSSNKQKKTISRDKSNSLKECYPNTRSLKMLVQELTGKEEDLSPYWKGCHVEKSKRLLSSIGIDLLDLDSSLSKRYVSSIEPLSWSTIEKTKPINQEKKNLPKTLWQSSLSMHVEKWGKEDIEDITFRSRSIKMTPSKAQKKILKEWISDARYIYNLSVEELKKKDLNKTKYELRNSLVIKKITIQITKEFSILWIELQKI